MASGSKAGRSRPIRVSRALGVVMHAPDSGTVGSPHAFSDTTPSREVRSTEMEAGAVEWKPGSSRPRSQIQTPPLAPNPSGDRRARPRSAPATHVHRNRSRIGRPEPYRRNARTRRPAALFRWTVQCCAGSSKPNRKTHLPQRPEPPWPQIPASNATDRGPWSKYL